eukprot:3536432-Prorocentrum_lima.AAC.1
MAAMTLCLDATWLGDSARPIRQKKKQLLTAVGPNVRCYPCPTLAPAAVKVWMLSFAKSRAST